MAYTPLSEQELKDMHEKLREQFTQASKMMEYWKKAGYYSEANTSDPGNIVAGYKAAAPIATAMAETAQALVAVDKELRDRQDQDRLQKLPKPKQ